ncbi:MAG: phosphopantetheine-binding protein [Clostridia bacterium]|nr:phosphopantetheine-binding protein [Clostridia bacterium]
MTEKEQIIEILTDINPDIDYENETALIDGGLLDSFDIVTLVGELNDAFDITITVVDLVPENFNSADAMAALVLRLRD